MGISVRHRACCFLLTTMIFLTTSLGLTAGAAIGWFSACRRAERATLRKHPIGMKERYPYRLRDAVFTSTERQLFGVLSTLVPAGYELFTKVRFGDLLDVTYGAGDRPEAYSRVMFKGLDFLICDVNGRPVLAICLGETAGSGRSERRYREFIDRVCAKVGLPLERLPIRTEYSQEDLRMRMARYFQPRAMEAKGGGVILRH